MLQYTYTCLFIAFYKMSVSVQLRTECSLISNTEGKPGIRVMDSYLYILLF